LSHIEKNRTKWIDCFICQPQPVNLAAEKPYRWLNPALACARHKAEAVLANGQPLALFLTSSDNGGLPPEESGFNYMLNPVFIEGVRGWCDFSAGGLAVHQELFSSQNYFEFYAQHAVTHLDFLYALYRQRAAFAGGFNVAAFIKLLAGVNEEEALHRLNLIWQTDQAVRQALAESQRNGALESPAELRNTFAACLSGTSYQFNLEEIGLILLNLANARFAHLNSKET
jgi:hypothetical protein